MTDITLKIDGMSCQHCVMRVKKALDALPGVVISAVAIGSASVSFDESKVSKEDIAASIEQAGYKIAG